MKTDQFYGDPAPKNNIVELCVPILRACFFTRRYTISIFLTGATGFVGSAVVADLIGAGHQVVGLCRSEESARRLALVGAEAVLADLKDLDTLRREARKADAVIHTAFNHDFSRMVENCELDRQAIEAFGAALEGSNKPPPVFTSGLPIAADGQIVGEDYIPPSGASGTPRVSEQTAMSMVGRGVRAMVIRMSQVHDWTKQGFATYLLDHARKKEVSAYPGVGLNQWPAIHRLDAARLYRLVLEKVPWVGITMRSRRMGCQCGRSLRRSEDACAFHSSRCPPRSRQTISAGLIA